jgi:hypothetical protein
MEYFFKLQIRSLKLKFASQNQDLTERDNTSSTPRDPRTHASKTKFQDQSQIKTILKDKIVR